MQVEILLWNIYISISKDVIFSADEFDQGNHLVRSVFQEGSFHNTMQNRLK